jgi:hypothetical protein
MLLPNRLANHFVFVAGDIGPRPFVNQIENDRNVDRAFCLAQVLCKQAAYVLGEGDAKLGSPRLRPPPHFFQARNKSSCVRRGRESSAGRPSLIARGRVVVGCAAGDDGRNSTS